MRRLALVSRARSKSKEVMQADSKDGEGGCVYDPPKALSRARSESNEITYTMQQQPPDILESVPLGEYAADLPQHLVEKILLRLPFPHILKARMLGKTWAANFADTCKTRARTAATRSSACYCHRCKKIVSTAPDRNLSSFQQEMLSVSHRWPVFAPAFYSESEWVGFAPQSSTWHRFALNTVSTCFPMAKSHRQMDSCGGCILSTVYSRPSPTARIRIANVFTGIAVYREIPAPAAAFMSAAGQVSSLRAIHVVTRGRFQHRIYLLYSVLAGEVSGRIRITAQIFDSISNSWETKSLEYAPLLDPKPADVNDDLFYYLGKNSSLLVGDILFFAVVGYPSRTKLICRFDLSSDKFICKSVPVLPRAPFRHKLRSYILTRARADVEPQLQLIMLWMVHDFSVRSSLRVSQFYLEVCSVDSKTLEVHAGGSFFSSPTDFGGDVASGVSVRIVHYNQVLYFCFCQSTTSKVQSRSIWSYHLRERAWRALPLIPHDLLAQKLCWISSAFVPGLNPLAYV